MIRPFTCLSVLLAAGSGLYLYSEKHRTTLLDDRIRAVVEDTHRIQDRTSMLRAEWALLNQPDRLQTLAAKFLPALAPIAPTQFVQMADLAKHLPPVGEPAKPAAMPTAPLLAQGATPFAPVTLASIAASQTSAPGASSMDVLKDAEKDGTKDILKAAARVTAKGEPRGEVRLAAARAPHRPAHHQMVVATAPARPVAAVREVASLAPRPAPMLAAAWRPAAMPSPTAPAFSGSALGMAHVGIAPPMPVAR